MDEQEPKVHMVMGAEEARILGVGLGLVLAHAQDDLDKESDMDAVMRLVSMKFVASNMFASIWQMLGTPVEEVENMMQMIEEGEAE